MLDVEERFVIRNLHRKGVSITQIARRTGHDRKTIRKVIHAPLERERRPRRRKNRKIDPFVPYLRERIEAGVLNARKLYHEIRDLGYRGKETQVRSFVQPYRQQHESQATVRFETEPGRQAQVDWAHFGYIKHHGKRRRLYAFLMTLGWSRTMYLEFTVSADMAWWLRCHLHAFQYLNGVTTEILHDNLKTAVITHAGDGRIRWNPRYLDFADYYGFTPRACRPYRAQTKGKVESGVRYVRGNFWPGLRYTDLADLNRHALGWLNGIANVRIHGTTGCIPFERLPDEGLMPIQDIPDYDTSLIAYRRSSRDCLISYEGNFYSVPAQYARQQVMLKVTEGGELSVLNQQGEIIAWHPLAVGSNQRVVAAHHYKGLHLNPRTPRKPGALQVDDADLMPTLWPDAPPVEVRPLDAYGDLVEVTP
jgi:transposase